MGAILLKLPVAELVVVVAGSNIWVHFLQLKLPDLNVKPSRPMRPNDKAFCREFAFGEIANG